MYFAMKPNMGNANVVNTHNDLGEDLSQFLFFILIFPSLGPHCDVQLPSGFCKGVETAPQNNKAKAQMRRGRRRRQDGCPWQDDRSSVVSPHSQVRGACGGPGQPHTDQWSKGHRSLATFLSSCRDFSDRYFPISAVCNAGIRGKHHNYLLQEIRAGERKG